MNSLGYFINTIKFFTSILILSVQPTVAQNQDPLIVYVWEFTTRDGKTDEVTTSLTEEFEEAITQSECCTILQRRYYSRLFEQKKNENAIMNLESLPKSALDGLTSLEANTVVFGEVYDDTNSGQVKISINFESFKGIILNKASTYIPKYALADPSKREEAVKKLTMEMNLVPSIKQPQKIQDHEDWSFALTGCQRSGNTVTCGFIVTSKYRDRNITIAGNYNNTKAYSSLAYDDFGYEYLPNSIKIGNEQTATGVARRLVADIPTSGKIVFPNISTRATKFPLLELKVQGDELTEKVVQFRDVLIE